MAGNFIAGVDAATALPTLKKLWGEGVAFSVDLLGEACVSDDEVAAYQRRYLDLIETLPAAVAQWQPNPRLETDYLGPIPRTNVSIKISSLLRRTDPIDFEGSLDALTDSLRPILEAAAKHNVLVNFDMEQFAVKDLTLTLFERCCEAIDFPAGLAVQAYLRSGMDDIQRVIAWAKRSGRQVTVRLIKGAYWDYETINAERMDWPVPVWSEKRETDACFERMAARIVEAMPRMPGEGRRQTRHRLAQHPLDRLRAGPARKTQPARDGRGNPKALGHGRSTPRGARPARHENPRVRARRRDDPRHGLLRPPAAGKHVEPIVAACRLLR